MTALSRLERNTWLSLHVFLHWTVEDVDRFFVSTLAPRLDSRTWFYLRYWDGGPHLRVRIQDADNSIADKIADDVRRSEFPVIALSAESFRESIGGPTHMDWHKHGDVLPIEYEPEVARYGGPRALGIAEDVFVESSRLAIEAIAAMPDRNQRLTLAADLARSTTQALEFDDVAAVSWLRTQVAAWRWMADTQIVPTLAIHRAAERVVSAQGERLRQRWDERPDDGIAGKWARIVRSAADKVAAEASHDPAAIWASQLHMLFNRLGITPDEERSVLWMVATALARPTGFFDYFDTSAAAPDRVYLENSKYSPALAQAQAARSLIPHPPLRLPGWAGPLHELSEVDPADVPLMTALQRRRSARGDMTGPLSARQIGSLLWTSMAATGITMVRGTDGNDYPITHRPHPSAGSRHSVRVRILALDVDGLQQGTYHVDWERRGLLQLAPAPDADSVTAISSWFAGTDTVMGLDISRLPALLGIYADLGYLRTIYGLRALRFACLETGHLAQNISLVAAGLDLATTTIGGFVDDAANELFCLDGVEETLLYLMPIGVTNY